MSKFFSKLRYSIGNEDPNTEHRALQIQPEDRIVCITASGDRPLHLLLNKCKEVVSIDLNPIQNHLLNLKIAALQKLDYDQYVEFLGADPQASSPLKRGDYLKTLIVSMNEESAKFWKKNEKMISKGILYQGAVERFVKVVARLIRLVRKDRVEQLFKFDDLEEQKKYVKQYWDRPWLRKVFNIILHPRVIRLFFDDPGLNSNIGPAIDPGAYLYERFIFCLNHSLAKENFFFSWVFRGYIGKEAYPPYLTEIGFQTIRKQVDCVSIKTQDVIEYLEKGQPNSFDCFSLSDVASYMKEEAFKRLLRAIYRAGKPGARFCMRQFLSSYEIPADLEPFFQRDRLLEKQLEKEDTSLVYRFTLGKVEK